MVLRFGTPDQVERWVQAAGRGRDLGRGGHDGAGRRLGRGQHRHDARSPEGGHWRLTGRKQFITNGCGDVCVVLARSEPGSKGLEGLSLFVVPRRENGQRQLPRGAARRRSS